MCTPSGCRSRIRRKQPRSGLCPWRPAAPDAADAGVAPERTARASQAPASQNHRAARGGAPRAPIAARLCACIPSSRPVVGEQRVHSAHNSALAGKGISGCVAATPTSARCYLETASGLAFAAKRLGTPSPEQSEWRKAATPKPEAGYGAASHGRGKPRPRQVRQPVRNNLFEKRGHFIVRVDAPPLRSADCYPRCSPCWLGVRCNPGNSGGGC